MLPSGAVPVRVGSVTLVTSSVEVGVSEATPESLPAANAGAGNGRRSLHHKLRRERTAARRPVAGRQHDRVRPGGSRRHQAVQRVAGVALQVCRKWSTYTYRYGKAAGEVQLHLRGAGGPAGLVRVSHGGDGDVALIRAGQCIIAGASGQRAIHRREEVARWPPPSARRAVGERDVQGGR